MENKFFTGVLLAGGRGSRLGDVAQGKNKALLMLHGRPLCYYAIDFLKNVGAEKILVLGGHDTEELRALVSAYDANIKVLEGDKRGSLYSVSLALPHIDNSFLLCNADHIYKKPIAEKVRAQLRGITAFCDFDRNLGDDDMKIWHDNFVVKKISKKLETYNGGYVGMTYYGKEMLDQAKAIFAELVSAGGGAVVEDALRRLIERGHSARVGDISGIGWLEVDFPEELERAKQEIAADKDSFVFNIEFDDKWKNINIKKSGDEFSLFVPAEEKPKTQRQINLYWYHKFFEQVIKNKNYKTGLELGCGRGTMSLYLNKYNGLDVTLLDISVDALKIAEDNFKIFDTQGNFVKGTSGALPFEDNSFDIVYSIGLLEHLEDYKKTLEESYRVLTPGGIMIHLNIPAKRSVQNINNLYKKILKIIRGKDYPAKDYWRNNDKPEDYLRTAEEAGFKNLYTVNVNPFPIFVPVSMGTDKRIAKIYNFIIKTRSLFREYPFKTSYLLSQGHFLVGYKEV